jgi:hypothetical protein
MEKEALKNIIDFLEKNDNKNKPFKWKLLNNEPLTEDELIINDDLDLHESKITYLPEGLMVYGSLDLGNCTSLTSLPKGLRVWGNLDISGTKLAKFSDNELREMIEPGFIEWRIIR